MQKAFYLSKNGTHVGPYSLDEIFKKLENREHSWMDYVYDEQKSDWVLLIEHPTFTTKFNKNISLLGQASAQKNQQSPSSISKNLKDKEWYTLKNGANFGPFSQLELIQMLQEKTIYEYDYIWHQSMSSWKRVAEVSEFSPERIKSLKDSSQGEISEIFFRRRHLRANYGCSIIVHNNKSVFRGQSLEISVGGAGLLIDNSSLLPGQTLFLHFQPGDGVPPFNAVCTIISKQVARSQFEDTKFVKYGVKFTSVSQNIRQQIKDFTEYKKVG